MTADELWTQVEYMLWADEHCRHSLQSVSEQQWRCPAACSYGSLAGTVEHLVGTQWVWLERLRGQSPRTLWPEGVGGSRQAVTAFWESVGSDWRTELPRHHPEEVVAYRTTAGQPHAHRLADLVLHVGYHTAAYRGQVAAVLRGLGGRPEVTDLIAYLRERDRAR